jgi:hypothetical protein
VLRRAPAAHLEELLIGRLRCWTQRQATRWSDLAPYLKRVELHREALVVQLAPPAYEACNVDPPEQCSMQNGILTITSLVRILRRGGRTACVHGPAQVKARPDKTLIAGFRRAHAGLETCGIDISDLRASRAQARRVGDP